MLSGFLQRSWIFTVSKKIRLNQELRSFELFHTGSRLCHEKKKKKRGFWPWSRKNDEEKDKIKITPPQQCAETGIPILDPECKVAIIVGGAAEIGIRAADSLLYHGARAVILVDEDSRVGENAAQSLCDFYGKNRARFYRCGLESPCQLEGIFEDTICRYKAVNVLFSNLDRTNNTAKSSSCGVTENQWSHTMRAIHTGIQYMGKENGGSGGIIVNAASILGFMGWPIDPTPVYCSKEPVVETTMDFAKIHPVEKTGVRLVALLKSNKPLTEVGLPVLPITDKNIDLKIAQSCETRVPSRIGEALIHVMARAKNGTTWLSEPAPCLRETPWLIHFPDEEGKTVDPKIYEQPNYLPLHSHCVVAPANACPAGCSGPKC